MRRHSSAHGQAEAKAILTRLALIFTSAPQLQEFQPDRAAGRGGELRMGAFVSTIEHWLDEDLKVIGMVK